MAEYAGGIILFKDKVLLLHKEGRYYFPKALRGDESTLDCACRSIREQMGIRRNELFLVGEIGTLKTNEPVHYHLFKIYVYKGQEDVELVDFNLVKNYLTGKDELSFFRAHYSQIYHAKYNMHSERGQRYRGIK